MTDATLPPGRVIPLELARAVDALPIWFVIGGQAVRCFCPYRRNKERARGCPTMRTREPGGKFPRYRW